jgi:hypothetical protein
MTLLLAAYALFAGYLKRVFNKNENWYRITQNLKLFVVILRMIYNTLNL